MADEEGEGSVLDEAARGDELQEEDGGGAAGGGGAEAGGVEGGEVRLGEEAVAVVALDGVGEDGLAVAVGDKAEAADGGRPRRWVDEERVDGLVEVGVVGGGRGDVWGGGHDRPRVVGIAEGREGGVVPEVGAGGVGGEEGVEGEDGEGVDDGREVGR